MLATAVIAAAYALCLIAAALQCRGQTGTVLTQPPSAATDEPTGNLDSATGQEILDLMCELTATAPRWWSSPTTSSGELARDLAADATVGSGDDRDGPVSRHGRFLPLSLMPSPPTWVTAPPGPGLLDELRPY